MMSWLLLGSIFAFVCLWWIKLPAHSAPEKAIKIGILAALWGGLGVEFTGLFSQLTAISLTFWWVVGILPAFFLPTHRVQWTHIVWPLVGCMAVYGWQAWYFPPNNYDSMAYHLPRILTWIQQQNVEFFPTGIARQLYYNPLAEYLLTHLYLAFDGDQALNLLQWLALAGSQLTVGLLLRHLGGSPQMQAIGMGLTLIHPMIGFESTTTQNDLVAGFFLLTSLYFSLRKEPLWLVLALVTGGWVKYTVWMLFVPWGIYWIWRDRSRLWPSVAGGIGLAICTIGPFWLRNLAFYQHPLGPAEGHPDYIGVTNQLHSIPALISNASRTLGNNLGLPLKSWNDILLKGYDVLHTHLLGLPLNDPRTTYAQFYFKPSFGFTEDDAGSLLWVVIVLLSLGLALFQKKNRLIWLMLLSSFWLFCLLLKYQPMHNRLLAGWLLALSVPIALGLRKEKNFRWIWGMILLLQLPIWIFNKSKLLWVPENTVRLWRNQPHSLLSKADFQKRPDYLAQFYSPVSPDSSAFQLKPDRVMERDKELVRVLIQELKIASRPSAWSSDRHMNYFQNRYGVYEDARRVTDWVAAQGCMTIDLWMGFDAMEYPIRKMILDQAPKTRFRGYNTALQKQGDCLLSMDRPLPENLGYQQKYQGQYIKAIKY